MSKVAKATILQNGDYIKIIVYLVKVICHILLTII